MAAPVSPVLLLQQELHVEPVLGVVERQDAVHQLGQHRGLVEDGEQDGVDGQEAVSHPVAGRMDGQLGGWSRARLISQSFITLAAMKKTTNAAISAIRVAAVDTASPVTRANPRRHDDHFLGRREDGWSLCPVRDALGGFPGWSASERATSMTAPGRAPLWIAEALEPLVDDDLSGPP